MKPDHIPSQKLTDETLCRLAASGDRVAEERLVMRYNRLVRMCARPYFLYNLTRAVAYLPPLFSGGRRQ